MKGGGGNVSTPDPASYMPLIQQAADINRIDQSTPFGGVRYNTTGPAAMSFDDWQAANPAPTSSYTKWEGGKTGGEVTKNVVDPNYNAQTAYGQYKSGLEGDTSAEAYLSPELQDMFTKQFDPNAYDNYSDDYMGRYNELIAPDRAYNADRFEQSMFDRGQPVGGEEYGAKYRQTIGDPNARQDIMAAQGAAGFAEQARTTDFNKLMSAMGMAGVNVPQIDTMGPANMAMNADVANANNAAQSSSNIWNTVGQGIGAYGMYAGLAASSHNFKEDKRHVDTLGKLVSIPVERWRYKEGIEDGGEHIGPYAEDFNEAFELGGGNYISLMDAVGVLMRSVQELAEEVRELKCQQ